MNNVLRKDLEDLRNLIRNFQTNAALEMLDTLLAPDPVGSPPRTLWLLKMGQYSANPGYANDGDKIGTIKAVRSCTSLGLREAKELVESLPKEIGPVREDHEGVKWLLANKAVIEWR